ncbi:MAG: hypothetical protein WBO17_08665, partial [Sphingorhabdus sp.]
CVAAAVRFVGKKLIPLDTGFATVLVLAAVYSIWTIYGAGVEILFWGIVLLMPGVPVYVLMKRTKARGSKAAA